MKNLQTWFLKFLLTIPFFFSCTQLAAQPQKIKSADSLFQSKQFTQSFELYQAVFTEKNYTPAMLLKMAYIQEGLGKIGPTIYYLRLYHLATDDEQALRKMEELAAKYKLSGFDSTDANRLQHWINKNKMIIQAGLALMLLATSLILFLQKRPGKKPWLATAVIILVSGLTLYLNNFYSSTSVIVVSDHTYLMDGPSAGAPVAGVVGEGNQFESIGQKDVWLKVRWMDKTVYVKKNSVRTVDL